MSKLKAPLSSFSAHGSLAHTLSFDRRDGIQRVRKMPLTPYRRTLAQYYQRIAFKNGLFYWLSLPGPDKLKWNVDARSEHQTGLSYFMLWYLSTLPDIAAWWHLDEKQGIVANDSGKNANDGAITGIDPIQGVIDSALHFDNVDATILVPHSPSLALSADFTLFCFLRYTTPWETFHRIYDKGRATTTDYDLMTGFLANHLYFYIFFTDTTEFLTIVGPLTPDTWHAIAVGVQGTDTFYSVDGAPKTLTPFTNNRSIGNTNLRISGNQAGFALLLGDLDNIIFYNRALDDKQLLWLSSLRYP